MRAPAWVWLALLGLAFVATHHQTAVDAVRPTNRQRQKAKLHFVCKEGDSCVAWPVRRGRRHGVMRSSNAKECGVARLQPSALHQAQTKTLQSATKTLGFSCKTINFLGANRKRRLRRQTGNRRGKFRGQTQSQYLNIGGHDNGKAEALSDADSSRAVVSGKSGMGQAQSQSVYDPSCDECGGSENMNHNTGPKVALNINGPSPDYSNLAVGSDTRRPIINPNNLNQQRPGTGSPSNNGNYGPPGVQNPLGVGNPYQTTWSKQQPGGGPTGTQHGINNYRIPNQGSFNTGIPGSNSQPGWLGGSQPPTQRGNGQPNIPGSNPVDRQIPTNGPNDRNGQMPNNGPNYRNRQIPNQGPIDRNGQIPNIRPVDRNGQLPIQGPMDRNGQIPNQGPMDRNGQIPNQGPMDRNGQIPNQGPMDRNGQIPNQGPMDRNGQIPNQGPMDRNGQIPNQSPMDRNGQIPNQGPMDRNGQIPNYGPMDRNGPIPNQGPMVRKGQIPNKGPIDRNGQIPNQGAMDRNGQIPNHGPMDRNGQIPNQGPMDKNGPIPNQGPMDRNGQIPNQGPIDRNGQIPSYRPVDGNRQIPYNGPIDRNGPIPNQWPMDGNGQIPNNGPGVSSKFPSQSNPDGSATSISTNPSSTNRFDQSPALYPSQLPNSYNGNLSPSTLPIPYGHSSKSFIGPNGETYICCIVAPNQNAQEFGNKSPPTIGQQIQGQLPHPGAQGQSNYPQQNSQYDNTNSPNYPNNQPGSTYGIRGQEANFPSIGSSGTQNSPYGDQTLPIDGSGTQGSPFYNSGVQNTYPGNVGSSDRGQTVPAIGNSPQDFLPINGNQGTPYPTAGQNPTKQPVGQEAQSPFNDRDQNPYNTFSNGGQQSLYNPRGQEQGAQGFPYYNSGQGQNIYPINNQNSPSLGSGTPYYGHGQNTPIINSDGQSSTNPILGGSQGRPYFNQGQSDPSFNVNGQQAPYFTSNGQNNVPATNTPFTNSLGQDKSSPVMPFGQDVRGTQDHQGYPYVNGVPSQGNGINSPRTQVLPNQSSNGGATMDGPWNNVTPYGTGSYNSSPGYAEGPTGSQLGGQGQNYPNSIGALGQTYPNTIGAQYPQAELQGAVGQTPTQEQPSNGPYGPLLGDRNMQSPRPGSYVIGDRGQGITSHGTGALQGNFPEGTNQPYGSVSNTLQPGNQNEPAVPTGNPNYMYPGAQTTGVSSQQGPYNTGTGPISNRDQTGPGYTQTSFNGMPPNEFDPNAILTEKDESEAQASITHDFNGTMAIASSKGGNEKGKANTQVQGSYTGSGSFSAQAQITDEDKGAESQVSGGKQGATSTALGKGKNNKSQANVQLGSETGSLQTQSQSETKHLSTNSQVQGGVKGGMADAQARGPGSTSSQAQIGFTPYKDGDKAHDILKTPFVGVGSASAQSNGKTGQSQSQLQGTFKYGITYNGAAQSGASVDKDAVFENRMPYKKEDVFEGEKNIDVSSEIPLPVPNLDIDDSEPTNNDNHVIDHPHAVHHTADELPKNTTPNGITRSFDAHVNNDKEKDYDNEPNREETNPDDYDGDGADPPEYYDEFPREQDTTIQHVNPANRRNIDVQQSTRGNTQRIVLGDLQGQNAEIVQKSSEHEPDYRRIYQPGERVPGTGGYIIPAGFTGSIQAISSRDRTIAVGSRESPSQAQTVSLTPGNGQINYITAKPTEYGKSVNSNQLKSINSHKPEDNRYMTVSKSVSGALDEDNKIKKEYSHTYYTKSSSCGYFTFTCTMVRGTNGTKKVCKPKRPTNPDGTPMQC